MQASVAARWLLLAFLWSLQYIFMRLAVPVFGAAVVSEARTLFGALFLLPWIGFFLHQSIGWRAHWRDHLLVGVVNNVLPFTLLAWAANALPAGYLSIINGMVPLWTAVVAAMLLGETLGARRLAGFVLGVAGVALIVKLGPVELDTRTILAALAAVAGSILWGWAGVIMKQKMAQQVPATSLAAGSITSAAVLMAPAWLATPPPETWTPEATFALVACGALCSGLSYLPLFTLVRDIGPTRTLSVGLIVPPLGVLWGWLVLEEVVTAPMLLGAGLVLLALYLVMRER